MQISGEGVSLKRFPVSNNCKKIAKTVQREGIKVKKSRKTRKSLEMSARTRVKSPKNCSLVTLAIV
jgi:hypothetical protein